GVVGNRERSDAAGWADVLRPAACREDGNDDCEVSAKWRAALHRPSHEGFFEVARTGTSPGFGRTARLPGDPSGVEPCCVARYSGGGRRGPHPPSVPASPGARARTP